MVMHGLKGSRKGVDYGLPLILQSFTRLEKQLASFPDIVDGTSRMLIPIALSHLVAVQDVAFVSVITKKWGHDGFFLNIFDYQMFEVIHTDEDVPPVGGKSFAYTFEGVPFGGKCDRRY